MTRSLIAAALAAACGFAAPLTLAAPAGSADDAGTTLAQAAPNAPEARGAQRGQHAQRAFQMPSERVEARLTFAKNALKITDAQQVMWDNFASVMRRQAREMDQRVQQRRAEAGQQGNARTVSAIDRLERAQQRSAQRAANLQELLGAARPLYSAFSPEQKQVADQMLAHARGGRGHHQFHRGVQQRPQA